MWYQNRVILIPEYERKKIKIQIYLTLLLDNSSGKCGKQLLDSKIFARVFMTNSTICNYTFRFYRYTACACQQMALLYLQTIITNYNKLARWYINSVYSIHIYIYIYIHRHHICSWRILYYMHDCDKKLWYSDQYDILPGIRITTLQAIISLLVECIYVCHVVPSCILNTSLPRSIFRC